MNGRVHFTFDEMWEIFLACDDSYDGLFYAAVKSTRIYCRPSCRSKKPKKTNVTFFQTIEEAEKAGFRPCKRCQPNAEQSPHQRLIANVIAFLVDQHRQKLVLEDIANHVGLSAYYLERLFKQHTSQTPRAFLEKIRVDKAAHLLLTTQLSHLDIAFEAGFQSPSNFYRAFRRHKHCSPNEYRTRSRSRCTAHT